MLLFNVVGVSGAAVVGAVFFYYFFLTSSLWCVHYICLSHTNPFCIFIVDFSNFMARSVRYTNTHTSHHSKFITEAVVVRSPHCRCRGRGRVYIATSLSLLSSSFVQWQNHTENVCKKERNKRTVKRPIHRKMHFFNFHTQTHPQHPIEMFGMCECDCALSMTYRSMRTISGFQCMCIRVCVQCVCGTC